MEKEIADLNELKGKDSMRIGMIYESEITTANELLEKSKTDKETLKTRVEDMNHEIENQKRM